MTRDSCDAGEGSWVIQPLCQYVARAQLTASGLGGDHKVAERGDVGPPRDRHCCHSPGGRVAGWSLLHPWLYT